MDNFREWLSDNLRYFMLGGVILIIVAVLFFGIRACVGSGKGTSDEEQNTVQDDGQGNDPSSPEDDGEANDGKKEEDTNPLVEGSAEITAFMQSYYRALGERDIATLRTLVSDLTASDESRITNAKDYIEGYEAGSVYTKKGLDENSYVVYTCYDYICSGVETPVPSLGYSYVVEDSSHNFQILGAADQNAEISQYMDELLSDKDVEDLRQEVQSAYDQAQVDDPALAQFLDGLGEDAASSSAAASGTMLTVTEGCNVRAGASSDAEVIGGLEVGTEVENKGAEGEWIQIDYEAQTAYVHSSLLE